METTRQKKVSRLLQKELADIFLKAGNKMAPGKLVSVTKVRITPDLSLARVYLSIFPSAGQDKIMKTIHDQTSKIRFEMGQRIKTQLRIVPEIIYSTTVTDYIDNIDVLLKP